MLCVATGDLAKRKLLPGLFHLAVAGMMPERYRIIGSGRPDGAPDAEGFVAHVREALRAFGRHELSDENWKPFAERLSFAASAEQPGALVQAVARAEQELGGQDVRRLVYLAVPPDAFGPMVSMIGASGLGERARLIVEKPFGHDLASARALNQTLHAVLVWVLTFAAMARRGLRVARGEVPPLSAQRLQELAPSRPRPGAQG